MKKRTVESAKTPKAETGGQRRVIARKDGRIEFGYPPPPFVSSFQQFGGYARGTRQYLAAIGAL